MICFCVYIGFGVPKSKELQGTQGTSRRSENSPMETPCAHVGPKAGIENPNNGSWKIQVTTTVFLKIQEIIQESLFEIRKVNENNQRKYR